MQQIEAVMPGFVRPPVLSAHLAMTLQRLLTDACGKHAAYLRHRLLVARKWLSMHPELDRFEAGQDAPKPRLGRAGIGPVGPRSAHPITPFRVRNQRCCIPR